MLMGLEGFGNVSGDGWVVSNAGGMINMSALRMEESDKGGQRQNQVNA